MTEHSNRHTGTNACSSGKTAGLIIAVFVDSFSLPCMPHEAKRVAFHQKQGGVWAETESRQVHPADGQSPERITGFIHHLASLTDGAQAVAGASIAGLLFTALNQQGKHIFEIRDLRPETLSGIAEDIAMADARQALAEDAFKAAQPAETDIPGVYTLDLVTALEEFPELSSKMILKPFLQSTPFTELTVICRHSPCWLETERGITLQVKQRGDYRVLTIQKACCGEAMI